MNDFFISYAREDGEFARALVERLTRLGWTVWIDEKDIPPSVPWMTEIQRAIGESMLVIAVESEHWLSSDACRIEVELAAQSGSEIVRLVPEPAALEDAVSLVVSERRALPEARGLALMASTAATIWRDSGRRRSLLLRGRPLRVMRRARSGHPDEFSLPATAFLRASGQAAARRLFATIVLALVAPVLALGIAVSIAVAGKVDERVATQVAAATEAAQRSTYAAWNIYSGIERMPTSIESTTAYRQLFTFLAARTPIAWDGVVLETSGSTTATSADGGSSVSAQGARVMVTEADGQTTILLASAPVTAVAWSPDSQWLAVATATGAEVISVRTGAVIALRGGAGAADAVRWQDASHVQVSGSTGTGTWRVFDGTPVADLPGVRYGAESDGQLFTVDSSGTLSRTDPVSGEVATLPGDSAEQTPTGMDAAAGTVVVAFGGAEPFLRVLTDRGAKSRDIPIAGCSPMAISLSPGADAAYLACTVQETNLSRVDLSSGAVTSAPMQRQMAYGVRALDDGVLWGGYFGAVMESSNDLSPRRLTAQETAAGACGTPVRKFVGAADGSELFPIGDGTGGFGCAAKIEFGESFESHLLIFETGDGNAAPDAAVSPDGSLVAYGLADGRVRVFTTDQLEPVYFAQVMPDSVRSISFSAGGDQLVVAGIGGQVVSIALDFTSAEDARESLIEDARTRLQNAIDWGIYLSTMDQSE
ncbi:TIR domain-containing protein [Microbacterium sp. W4I20]|uniref:TIR domain-containing protein n=1 Tax=Microbacterium sp. W4I20 TaxID=3042262 RepID=UPI0027D879A0|nr:TIR domain-containing protein [Microbacterium sp. W4I20]